MVKFYKHDIADWMDGTEGLSDGAYRAYHVICQLIYLNEGPIKIHERGLAGRCNQRVDHFKRNLNDLLTVGCVVSNDGLLSVYRCSNELLTILYRRSSVSKSLKNKGATQPQPPLEKSREEKIRLDNKEEKSLVVSKENDSPEIKEMFELWNMVAEALDLPLAKKLTSQRRQRLRRILKEHGMAEFKEVLRNLETSNFLRGENNRGWRADLDFVLQPKSFVRILESSYVNNPTDDQQREFKR